jgi:hypothetical protein
MRERGGNADVVESREETPYLSQLGVRHLIKDSSSHLWKYGVEDSAVCNLSKSATIWELKGLNNWDLYRGTLLEELMLLSDLLASPAARTVKFYNPVSIPSSCVRGEVYIELSFIHSVFQAVQREHSPGTTNAQRLNRLKHLFWGELKEELGC